VYGSFEGMAKLTTQVGVGSSSGSARLLRTTLRMLLTLHARCTDATQTLHTPCTPHLG
jgi:hypothetical protein